MVAVPESLHAEVSTYAFTNRMYIREVVVAALHFYMDFMKEKMREGYLAVDEKQAKETVLKRMREANGAPPPAPEPEFTAAELKKMVALEEEQRTRQAAWDVTYQTYGGLTTATKKPLRKTASVPAELIALRRRYGRVVLGVEMSEAEAVEVRDGMLEAILASGVTEG